jgi:hypothetical protein
LHASKECFAAKKFSTNQEVIIETEAYFKAMISVLKFPGFLRLGYSGSKNPITRFPVPVLGKKNFI